MRTRANYPLNILATIISVCILNTTCSPKSSDDFTAWLPPAILSDTAAPGSPDLPAGTATDYSMIVRDVASEADFAFDTVAVLDLRLRLADSEDAPLAGSLVQFRAVRDGRAREVVFQAMSGADGRISGNCTIATTIRSLRLDFTYGGRLYTAPLEVADLSTVDRTIVMNTTAVRRARNTTPTLADRDGDGITDDADHFPDDPARATLLRFPADGGRFTVAFEDLYPNQGDADFNDYVLQFNQEEHLNAAGEVVRILGSYRHVAKAAGYNHVLKLNLPLENADYSVRRFDPEGNLLATTAGSPANFHAIALTERSDRTISQSNAHRGQDFVAGDLFELEVNPAAPVSKDDLGAAPYDLFLHVKNTNRDVHFAGRFFDGNDNDLYLDADGFPWALLVPVDWRWMYERTNIHTAYEFFDDWYMSAGADRKDWYNFPDVNAVVASAVTRFSAEPAFVPPPGFHPADFTVNESLRPVPARINETYIPVSAVYDIDPVAGGSITFPGDLAEIRFPYDRDALIDAGLPEEFTVFYYNAPGDNWLPVEETSADTENGMIIARTSHLTPFIATVNTTSATTVCVDFPQNIALDGVPFSSCTATGPLSIECVTNTPSGVITETYAYPNIDAAQASLFDGPLPNLVCDTFSGECAGYGSFAWFRGDAASFTISNPPNPDVNINNTFAVDTQNRLVAMDQNGNPNVITYGDYDANGFPESVTFTTGPITIPIVYEYDGGATLPKKRTINNTLIIEYDANGRQTSVESIPGGWTRSVTNTGTVQLCGNPAGPPTTAPADLPVKLGTNFSCAVVDGAAKCWGQNNFGQLGNGTNTNSAVPVQVSGLTANVVRVEAGQNHACAILNDGSLRCWGQNNNGQLGDGTTTDRNTPVQVSGLTSGVSQVSPGGNFSCAIVSGTAHCWGDNSAGGLGVGSPLEAVTTPLPVVGLSNSVSDIGAGTVHVCAVDGGEVYCWGNNLAAQLGDGTTTPRTVPTGPVPGLTGATNVTAGTLHSCALVGDAVYCWGSNSNYEIGDASVAFFAITPTQPTGLGANVSGLYTNARNNCAVLNDGTGRCWGNNQSGQIGVNAVTFREIPSTVLDASLVPLANISGFGLGGGQVCAVSDGDLFCWGKNDFGQLGDGSFTNRSTAQPGPAF